jgi:hypothetical protein
MSILELQAEQQPLEIQQLQAQFKIIAQKLIDQTPGIVDAMIDIHKNLQMHEELVSLLDDNDIQMLHKAHEKHKQFVLIQVQEKAIKGGKKKLTSDDLSNL